LSVAISVPIQPAELRADDERRVVSLDDGSL
jgi:hypothetical protein